jgi:hypothetical protein
MTETKPAACGVAVRPGNNVPGRAQGPPLARQRHYRRGGTLSSRRPTSLLPGIRKLQLPIMKPAKRPQSRSGIPVHLGHGSMNTRIETPPVTRRMLIAWTRGPGEPKATMKTPKRFSPPRREDTKTHEDNKHVGRLHVRRRAVFQGEVVTRATSPVGTHGFHGFGRSRIGLISWIILYPIIKHDFHCYRPL